MYRRLVPVIALSSAAVIAGCEGGSGATGPAQQLIRPADTTQAVNVKKVKIVSNPFGILVEDRYSLYASTVNGITSGTFVVVQTRYDSTNWQATRTTILASGTITCLHAEQNWARVGGVVDASTFAGLPPGAQLTWSVTDNGASGTDDTSSQPLGNDAQAYCTGGARYTEQPVGRGNVNVKS